jgi:hypothetical protein
MAVFFFVLAVVGGVVVGDLVLENTAASGVTVLNQTVTGYTEGTLLALAAALGLVVGLLLVASMGSTKARRARRRQLRGMRAGMRHHVAEPEGEHAGPPDEFSPLQQTGGELGEPATPAGLGREHWVERSDGRRVAPEPTSHHPQSRHDQTRRAVHLRDDPDPWFQPGNERPR